MKIDIHKTAPGTGDMNLGYINASFARALKAIHARIDSRFRGSRIATGKHVAKVKRLLGIHPNTQKFCECGQLWEKEAGMDDFGCWSCGAKEPMEGLMQKLENL